MRIPITAMAVLLVSSFGCNEGQEQLGVGAHHEGQGAQLTTTASTYFNAEAQRAYDNLKYIATSNRTILGQQRSTLSGVGTDGKSLFSDGNYTFTSDIKNQFGQNPGMLGMDVWDFATKNPTWNQASYSKAIRDFYAGGKGGLITFDWHMRGCDTQAVTDSNGNSGMPGYGFNLQGQNDPQMSCTCRIVNEEPWKNGKSWLDWLYTEKLDRMANKIKAEGLAQVPLLFRPFHEQTGNWFWWGSSTWDCAKILGNPEAISGPAAFKKLYRSTVGYMRGKQGLKNLIYVFSPDKLHYAPWVGKFGSADINKMTVDQLKNTFDYIYPGDDVVDVVGLDLYFPQANGASKSSHAYHRELFRKNLQALTLYAEQHNKVAALTEGGNYNLEKERGETNSEFFTTFLKDLLLNDPSIKLAYFLFWENRRVASTEYYTPFRGHGQFDDFQNFMGDKRILKWNDVSGIYQKDFGPALPPTTPPPSSSSNANSAFYPDCASAASDPDGDGWGWENNKSCRVLAKSKDSVPECKSSSSDPDGDGWGWENNQSCTVAPRAADTVYPVCQSNASDPDGDGWGFENNRSCVVPKKDGYPTCQDPRSDPDRDGWGWENNKSCRVR